MLFLTLALATSPALACSCATGLDDALPEDGAVGVALDAAPFLHFSSDPGTLRLVDAATGADVPVTVDEVAQASHTVVRLVPTAPLEPLHTYTIEGDPGYGRVALPLMFTTGEAADAVPPDAVTLGDVEPISNTGGDSSCGPALYLIAKPRGATPDAYFETEVSWTGDFSDAVAFRSAERGSHVLGWGLCDETVPELQTGDDVWVRSRAVDLSGNAGPWSDVAEVRGVGGGVFAKAGCASVGGAPVAGGALGLALLGLGLRRRSRRG